MEEIKTKYAYLLIHIENWDSLRESLTPYELELFESQFSDFVSLKLGSSFRSLIINTGEFFVIANNQPQAKSLLKFSGEIKHQFKVGTNFSPKDLIVSIAITTKAKDMEAYDILLYLRNILQICRTQKQSDILCVA